MKNLFISLVIIIASATSTFAQDSTKGLQKITYGVVGALSGSTTLTDSNLHLNHELKQLKLGYGLSPNVCFLTHKTYHNLYLYLMYGNGNCAGKAINGYKLKKDWGLYLSAVKNFNTRGGYLGVGTESFVKTSDNVTSFLFVECGVNVYPKQQSQIVFTFGVHTNIQKKLWGIKTGCRKLSKRPT